jgi:transposase-like protein
MNAGRSVCGVQRTDATAPSAPPKLHPEYRCRAYEPGIKAQLVDMAINGSGIRDTARVFKIDKNTVN